MKLKSRKLWLAVGTGLVTSALVYLGSISAAEWKTVVMGTVGAYMLAQGATDAAEKYRGG